MSLTTSYPGRYHQLKKQPQGSKKNTDLNNIEKIKNKLRI
jgi:hypothetical protein